MRLFSWKGPDAIELSLRAIRQNEIELPGRKVSGANYRGPICEIRGGLDYPIAGKLRERQHKSRRKRFVFNSTLCASENPDAAEAG